MKNRKNIRFLSVLFCFMFLFFVGCDGGMGGIGGGDDGNPQSLAGAKTLSRPAEYNFSDAVGENASQYYYNIFARHVLYNLYNIYESNIFEETARDILLKDIDTENGETYTTFTGYNQYYLFDSLRYSITDVTTTYNADGAIESQTLTLDTNSGWEWTIKNDATGVENFFILLSKNESYKNVVIVDDNVKPKLVTIYGTDWLSLFDEAITLYPTFSEYYGVKTGIYKENGSGSTINYWLSPYYEKNVATAEELEKFKTDGGILPTVNYFQDTLEYATYLFVLGYDYVEETSPGVFVETEDAPLFDFEVQYNPATGVVTDVKVNGWDAQAISIVDALRRVKALYQEQAGFIGLTSENKDQIARFIEDKIIGENAMANDKLTVTQRTIQKNSDGVAGSPVVGTPLKFNRNYSIIIENIINYACSQAPIGYDSETGESLTLDNAYPVSKITDYSGDYFFLNYENDDDSELFKYIEAAEYQSLIMYPQDEDLGKPLEDIWLAFEYYENPDPTKRMAESITINVGFRYYSSTANGGAGEVVCEGETQIEVKYGKNGEVEGENPDVNWVYIGYSANEPDQYDIALTSGLTMNTSFNNNIGGGVLNPFVSGTEIEESTASKLVTGTDAARSYYKLNPSSSYGFYSTLDESKFSVNEAGEEACDFIEIYFDINKEKGVSGISYNYKVGLYYVGFEDV